MESTPSLDTIAFLRQRTHDVFGPLPKALAGDEGSVHLTRVAARRLRVALPLLARKPTGRRVKRALRILKELTRVVGASRDLHVGLGLLEARLERPRSTAQRRLLQRLRAGSQLARRRSTESALDVDIARLRRDLRKVIERGAEDPFTVGLRVRELRVHEGPDLLEGIEAMARPFDAEALHVVRRRARRLRYVAEVADALRSGDDEGHSGRPWKKLQNPLGQIHDHVLLAAWLQRAEESARERNDRALATEAAAQRAWAEATARRIHDELVAARPREIVLHALEALGASRPAA